MSTQKHFRLTRQAALLAVISAAFPVTGYCVAAGRADFVVGNVVAVSADGRQRQLSKGAEINSGDAISTALGARAQIRFTDGGYISLQPNTQFRVDTYQYEGKTDGKEKGFFSLLKGGLRAISGAIGHVNREGYQVATPAATIGIRGTGYNAMLGEGLTVNVTDGIVTLTNKGGSLIIPQGQSAFVADLNTAPSLTFDQPATPPASFGGEVIPLLVGYIAGDNFSNPTAVLTGLYSVFSGTVLDGSSGSQTTLGSDTPGILAVNSSGNRLNYVQGQAWADNSLVGGVTDFTAATLATGSSGTDTDAGGYLAPTNASIAASGADTYVNWGRFYGPLTYTDSNDSVTTTLTSNQGVHSVVGIPTAVMPVSGSAHYNLTGATAPTLASGGVAPGMVTGGRFDVQFNTAKYEGQINLTMGGFNTYALSFNGVYSDHVIAPTNTYVSSACGCAGSCSASVEGSFYGANAERMGAAYKISNTTTFGLGGSPIQGSVVYSKTANPAVGAFP